MARPRTLHDKLFRVVFREPAYARAELEHVLPAAVSACIDWTTLRLEESQLATERDDQRADLVFSAEWRAVAGRPAGDRAYFLLEHKSRAREDVALQVFRYIDRMLEAWCNERQQGPRGTKRRRRAAALPVVIAVVVQHGRRSATATALLKSIAFHETPGDPIAALSRRAIFVDDLMSETAGGLLAASMPAPPRFARFCLARAALEETFEAELASCVPLLGLVEAEAGPLTWKTLERYIYHVGHIAPDRLLEIVARATPAVEVSMKTTKEQLLEQGRAEGRAEGQAAGRAEGKAEGKAELLEDQLTSRFGALDAATRARLHAASEAQLREWARRILVAKNIEEVFANA